MQAECQTHAPIPDTIAIEGTHDAVEVTLATTMDPRTWPRIALCRYCGRGVRLRTWMDHDWSLVNGGGE